MRKGRAAKDEPLRKVLRSELSKKGQHGLKEASALKATLLALKDKGQKQEDGNTVDFLWNTYGKCHTDDRKSETKQLKQHDMILLTESEEVIRLLPERHVLSDRSM